MGLMGAKRTSRGYTLIGLVVVIAVISVVFFFAVPRIGGNLLVDPKRRVSQWMLTTVPALKDRAVREQKNYVLQVDIGEQRFRVSSAEPPVDSTVTDTAMFGTLMGGDGDNATDGASREDKLPPFALPESIRVDSVEFPGPAGMVSGPAEIVFYAQGYSDKALIHMQDAAGRPFAFLIETFLPQVRIYEDDIHFND